MELSPEEARTIRNRRKHGGPAYQRRKAKRAAFYAEEMLRRANMTAAEAADDVRTGFSENPITRAFQQHNGVNGDPPRTQRVEAFFRAETPLPVDEEGSVTDSEAPESIHSIDETPEFDVPKSGDLPHNFHDIVRNVNDFSNRKEVRVYKVVPITITDEFKGKFTPTPLTPYWARASGEFTSSEILESSVRCAKTSVSTAGFSASFLVGASGSKSESHGRQWTEGKDVKFTASTEMSLLFGSNGEVLRIVDKDNMVLTLPMYVNIVRASQHGVFALGGELFYLVDQASAATNFYAVASEVTAGYTNPDNILREVCKEASLFGTSSYLGSSVPRLLTTEEDHEARDHQLYEHHRHEFWGAGRREVKCRTCDFFWLGGPNAWPPNSRCHAATVTTFRHIELPLPEQTAVITPSGLHGFLVIDN
jgi:hypothetical protein